MLSFCLYGGKSNKVRTIWLGLDFLLFFLNRADRGRKVYVEVGGADAMLKFQIKYSYKHRLYK